MAGRQYLGAQFARGGEKVAEFDRLIAVDAWNRSLARHVARCEAIDNRLLETAFVVEHVVRNTDALGNRTRIMNILPGTARALAVRCSAVVVELQRHANDIVALGLEQR